MKTVEQQLEENPTATPINETGEMMYCGYCNEWIDAYEWDTENDRCFDCTDKLA